MEFKSEQAQQGNDLVLKFTGTIDEDVEFPAVEGAPGNIRIDLQGVKSINSVGIREWLNWIKPLSEKSKIVLENCPKPLVFQLNMVEGFLPKNGTITSFYVPYFCEKCDTEKDVLFKVGEHVTIGGGNYEVKFDVKTAKLCDCDPSEMELDATESKYFQFLKRIS